MVRNAVKGHQASIQRACQALALSETCHGYRAKASQENVRNADWLMRLTSAYRELANHK